MPSAHSSHPEAVRVRLFGKIQIQRDGVPVSEIAAKALELLCYLLLYRNRAHARERLSEVLWPEASPGLSKKYLRQTLWQLQTMLASGPNGGQTATAALLILSPGWVRINPDAAYWLDVEALEQAQERCQDIAGPDLTAAQAQTLETAVALYRGDLIEGWYQDWCIYERDRLQLTYLAMLEQLLCHCEARGWYAKGVAYGHCILRYDPARECTHRQLMRLHYVAGDRTTALRQYERCAAAVAKAFDLRPSVETVALYEQIRADRLEDRPHAPSFSPQRIDRSHGSLLVELYQRLDQIQASLSALHQHVQEELTATGLMLQGELETPGQTLHKTE